jgi:recombination protein RecT
MMAAALDLPINPNLGFAYIIPYDVSVKNADGSWGKVTQPQFQIGYKGLNQLAIRSGQYDKINAIPVYKNQFKSYNALTEELDCDFGIEGKGEVAGYVAYFKLHSGFQKTVYWSKEKVVQHATKYSQAFKSEKGKTPWKDETQMDGMGCKTVLKNLLTKWGILSVQMQKAILADQAVVKGDVTTEEATFEYVDNQEPSKDSKEHDKLVSRIKQVIDNSSTLKELKPIKETIETLKDTDAYDELVKSYSIKEIDLEEMGAK